MLCALTDLCSNRVKHYTVRKDTTIHISVLKKDIFDFIRVSLVKLMSAICKFYFILS